MKKNNPIIFLLLLTFCSTVLHPYSFLDKTFYGDKIFTLDARSLGMGTSGFACGNNVLSLSKNPALLSETARFSFSFSGQALVFMESRSFPAHGYGQDFVADNTYFEKINYYDDYAVGAGFNWGRDYIPAAAIVYQPLYDLRFSYEEEVRGIEDPYEDELIGINSLNSDGKISGISIGLSEKLLNIINLGIAYRYLWGYRNTHFDVVYQHSVTGIRNETQLEKLSGSQFSVGATIQPMPRYAFGLAYNTPASAKGTLYHVYEGSYNFYPGLSNNYQQEVSVKYPGSFGLGVEYRPQSKLFSRLNVDLEYTFWEDAKVVEQNSDTTILINDLENTLEIKGGVEHLLYNKTPVRFGFHIAPAFLNNEIVTTYFDLGSGFSFSSFELGISLEYGSKIYREMDLFPDGDLYSSFGGENRDEKDKVKVSELRILFTLNFNQD
ncbi:hypothetical protein JW877_08395 [bacterium]|nr:hypothetical protein [bacterium]